MMTRLRDQLDIASASFAGLPIEAWDRKPVSGKWSARENLAHLARYHQVFLERLENILTKDRPKFARYRAEDDREWPAWQSLGTDTVQVRIRKLRDKVIAQLSQLSDEQLTRTGIHPALGEMNVMQWTEFFLLHEAHHLYAILFRLRESG